MEVSLDEKKDKYVFKRQYKNQNLYKLAEFREWYKNLKDYVDKENKIRGPYTKENYYKYDFSERHLIISFCPFCDSFGICYIEDDNNSYSLIICNNCKEKFCIGCLRKPLNQYDYTICFKGFLIILYYRIKDRRSGNTYFKPLFYFYHIITCLFLTPIYLGVISSVLGFLMHRKRTDYFFKWVLNGGTGSDVGLTISFLRGALMFPYIITFFPFMLILLIPAIFSFNYYLYIYNMYITIFMPGSLGYDDTTDTH